MKITQYDIARNQWKIAKNWSFVYSGLAQISGINDHLTYVFWPKIPNKPQYFYDFDSITHQKFLNFPIYYIQNPQFARNFSDNLPEICHNPIFLREIYIFCEKFVIRFKPYFVLARQIVICRKKMPVWAKYDASCWVYVAT